MWEMNYEDAAILFKKQLDDMRKSEVAKGTPPQEIDQILAEA